MEIRCDQLLCLSWMMDQANTSNIIRKSTPWIEISCGLQIFGMSSLSICSRHPFRDEFGWTVRNVLAKKCKW
jgi:hypothetical protein